MCVKRFVFIISSQHRGVEEGPPCPLLPACPLKVPVLRRPGRVDRGRPLPQHAGHGDAADQVAHLDVHAGLLVSSSSRRRNQDMETECADTPKKKKKCCPVGQFLLP